MRSRILLCLVLALFFACGGKQSMASKSAAAYSDAVKKGIPVVAGEHGGTAHEHHAATQPPSETAHEEMPGMDHSKMDHSSMSGMDHSKMDHSSMAGMDHSKMDHSTMSGMDHSKMDHSSMAGMDHSKMDHSSMTGMDHSKMDHASMAGMDHSSMAGMQHEHSAASAEVNMNLEAPRSSGEIARIHPGTTLHTDEFDAPKTKDH